MRQARHRRLIQGTVGVAVWWWLLGVVPAQEAAPPAAPPAAANAGDDQERSITMDFQDVDIAVLVKFISEITNKNFIIDEKVRGKITIISPAKISVDEAYLVFQSVLQVKGFTTVPSGSIIKIVPSKDAKSNTVDTVLPQTEVIPRDEFITRLIPLRYVDSSNMVGILQPLISPEGLLAAYGPTNTLILIDTAAQTDRVIHILSQLDVESHERGIEMVRLNYAFAGDIATLLQQVLEEPGSQAAGVAATQPGAAPDARLRRGGIAGRPGGTAAPGAISGGATPEQAFRIIPDERTNSLILLAGPLELRRIKDLIARLDVPLPLGTGRIHVYYLKYANSIEMADVLGSLIGGGGGGGIGGMGGFGGFGGMGGLGGLAGVGGRGFSGRGGGTFGSSRFGSGVSGGFGSSMGGFGQTGMGGFGQSGFSGLGQSGFGASGSLGGRTGGFGGRGTGGVGGVGGIGGQQGPEFEGMVRLTADPATNALIINASPQDFETLKEVIQKLDVRRRQVYVEAIIAEVNIKKTRELGIEFQGATDLPNGVGLGRTNLRDVNQLLTPQNLSGLVLAAASSQTITIPGVGTIPAQQALLRALQSDSGANILSAPTVLTTDNQEAEIVSGENVPFIASRSTDSANLANTFATIERRDVGITLRITPQISEGGSVRLFIFQEVSKVIASDPQLGPTTSIRSATTTVVARNGQTVVIGGLISDDATKDENRVPFFGDIPFIGNFFKANRSINQKVNLLIFLTPHIIRTERDARNLSVTERDRIVRKPFEDLGEPGPKWQQLYTPSWEVRPSLEEEEEEEAEAQATGSKVQVHRPFRTEAIEDPSAPHKARTGEAPGAPVAPEPRPENGSAASVGMSDSYVLLAALGESGTPPPSLESSNGLLALAIPRDSGLVNLFNTGGSYRFEQGGYAAHYKCLEVFATPDEAFAIYPEGMQVSSEPITYLRWREPTEPGTLSPASWQQAH